MRASGARTVITVVGSLTLALGMAAVPAAQAAPLSPGAGVPDRAGDSVLLPAPSKGKAALRELGADLAAAARLNRTTPTALSRLLTADPTMWLDTSGQLFVKDPAPAAGHAAVTSRPGEAPRYDYDQTFLLHSSPGSQRTLYLDFDGEVVSGTAWNASGVTAGPHPAFSLDSDPAAWTNAELEIVQSVFDRVAEDYAPFDVDVTTQEPAAGALVRSSSADQAFGARVLISPSADAVAAICGGSCGGVAYVGVFGMTNNTYYQPAWVFPQKLSNNAKYIAEAVSHEAGHNLGLSHDGTSSVSYYTGQANWAPIMGVGYYKPLSQWSRGEYADANNLQDDVTVIQSNGLSLAADDFGSSLATATALASEATSGLIGSRNDVDVFAVTRSCNLPLTASVAPAAVSPNLDASVAILAGDGTVVATDDPASTMLSSDVAGALGASVSAEVVPGTYYIQVDGVGVGSPLTAYSDYGSLGRYTLTVPPCPTPSAPTGVTVTKDDTARSATINWEPPASDGGFPVTGYRVTRSGRSVKDGGPLAVVVDADTRSVTFPDLGADSRYRLTVAALNANGSGPEVGAAVRVRPGNLLVNGSFEVDRDRDHRPDEWRVGRAFTRSHAVARTGRFAGRHESDTNTTSRTSQQVRYVVGGSGYRFAGWVRVRPTTDRFGYFVRVRWLAGNGDTLRVDTVMARHRATRGWLAVHHRLTSPDGARRAKVQLTAASLRGAVYVDGLRLRRR